MGNAETESMEELKYTSPTTTSDLLTPRNISEAYFEVQFVSAEHKNPENEASL